MKRKLLIALLATILCLSVVMLAACGCEHYYENGVCIHCNEVDPNYDPNNAPCVHYYNNGVCINCGDVDPNYVPSGDGEDRNAISLRKAGVEGTNGQEVGLTGTVFALDTNGYYINDSTASMFIADTTAVNIGDRVYLKATLTVSQVLNKVFATATETEVLSTGSTALQATKEYVMDTVKLPATAENYYRYLELVGFVALEDGVYYLTMDDSAVAIDQSNNQAFQNYVGQKLTATVVVVDYTNTWVVKTVTSNAIAVTPADLDVVATEIFEYVQTQVAANMFETLQLPTSYQYEPTVNFAWSTTLQGATISESGVLTVTGSDQDVTVPLTLTLTCDGKTKTQTYSVSCNADYIYDYVQSLLPSVYPNRFVLPTSYPQDASVKFAWSVAEGSAIAISEESETVEEVTTVKTILTSEDVNVDTTVKVRLTLSTDSNERSKDFTIVLKAPISIGLADVASQERYTPVKVEGTVLMTAHNQTRKVYSVLIYDTNCKMLQVDFGEDSTVMTTYGAGDKVSVYGRVAESVVASMTIKSLSVKEVVVDAKAAPDYQFSLTGFNIVDLAVAADYTSFLENLASYGGTTIAKIANPYMVYSGSSSYNFVRFGPTATSAADGYSASVNGSTLKRVFCFSRNILDIKTPGLEAQLAPPKKSAGAKLYNDFYIYAVPMYMGSDTLQFVPLGVGFYQYGA